MAKVANGFWDKEILVQEFVNTGGKSATKVKLVEKDGKSMLDVRKYVPGKGGQEGVYAQHTAKGMTLELGDIMNVAGALLKASEYLQAQEQATPPAPAKKRRRRRKKSA